MMKISLKNTMMIMLIVIMVLVGGNVSGQLDDRFGAKGVEGTIHLGQKGLNWYRDWQDSYLQNNYPAINKNKIWTVGKIDYRTDGLGMDWRWIILDLLEDTEVDFLQNLLNLCLAIVDSNIVPIIRDYWSENRPLLETQLEDTLNNFTYTEKKYGIKYRATCRNTNISFQEALPQFILTVQGDSILFNTSLIANWNTHIYIEAWVLNPNPFDWGYHWKDIGDADCEFQTTIQLSGNINLEGQGRERHLQIKNIIADSRTESDIDWSVFGISFSWEGLSNEIEDLVDDEIEPAMSKELNKPPITNPYYFVDFFKSLFSGGIVPTQQEILDQIWNEEQSHIIRVIRVDGYEGQYWSIGYEPNWFPMLEPAQYAEFYTNYYRLIKRLDSDAKVMGPSLFLTEAIVNPGQFAWLFIPDFFKDFLAGIRDEFKNLIISYVNMADSKNWYREFISHLPGDVTVDVNDFQIFPVNADSQTVDWDSLAYLMNEMAVFMRNESHAEDVWVSEFGNIDWRRSENEVVELCRNFCQYFKSNTVGIKKWFWFLSYGQSPFYDMPFAPDPPITALLNNNFSLTAIGNIYLCEADCTPPIMTSAPTDEGKFTNPGRIAFYWNAAQEFDTGVADYRLQVKSEPGNITIFNDWVGNQLTDTITCYSGNILFARVQAKNGAGLIGDWSGWSNGITIRVDSAITADTDSAELSDGKALPGNNTDSSNVFSAELDHSVQDARFDEIEFGSTELPNSFKLFQNYPNPFNSGTVINYQLPEACHVVIKIYNNRGAEVKTLVDEHKTAGYFIAQWNGRDHDDNQVASGIYLYRIQYLKYFHSKKMVFVE